MGCSSPGPKNWDEGFDLEVRVTSQEKQLKTEEWMMLTTKQRDLAHLGPQWLPGQRAYYLFS